MSGSVAYGSSWSVLYRRRRDLPPRSPESTFSVRTDTVPQLGPPLAPSPPHTILCNVLNKGRGAGSRSGPVPGRLLSSEVHLLPAFLRHVSTLRKMPVTLRYVTDKPPRADTLVRLSGVRTKTLKKFVSSRGSPTSQGLL